MPVCGAWRGLWLLGGDGLLLATFHGVEQVALLVHQMQLQVLLAGRQQREAALSALETGALHVVHLLARQRCAGVHHIVYRTTLGSDVLEVVYVSADVQVYLLLCFSSMGFR